MNMEINTIRDRKISINDFYWKHCRPWMQTINWFSKIFNLIYPDFNNIFFIKSVEWENNFFKIFFVEKTTWEIIWMTLKDNKNFCWNILCTEKLCTWIHCEISNERFLNFFIHFFVKWKHLKIEHFLNILTNDFKIKKEYYQIFWKSNRPQYSIIQDWGNEIHKTRFLVPEWSLRNVDQSISLNLPEASIHHSERECQWISPNNKDKWYHFFNFPNDFYNHNFDKYYYLDNYEKNIYIWKSIQNEGWCNISTDLNEEDIVMWNSNNKLSNAIEYVINKIDKYNIKVISFNCCCVPRIVWDDIYSTLKKSKNKINIPFIFKWQLEKSPYEQKVELLDEYIKKINLDNLKKNKNSISLFWFHENIYQKHMVKILNNYWIKINTSFIPSIDVRLLELMLKSELFVFSPNDFQREAFEYPFKTMWIKYISPVYPYSFKNSEIWIREILDNFNINFYETNDYVDLKNEYNNLIAYVDSKKYTVWVVLTWKKELENFLNPNFMNNVDVLSFLDEMWFSVSFFIYNNINIIYEDYNILEDEIYNKSQKAKIIYFSDINEINNILKNYKLNILYSDIYFDDRIYNNWLSQFSLKNFYLGFHWSIKTIKEFIKLSEMTFYKNYCKYFTK